MLLKEAHESHLVQRADRHGLVAPQQHAQPDATFLFEVVNKRYQAQKSIILTSNKSFGQWDEIFPDPVLAIALLDRLLHRATTLKIRGESYRLRHRRKAGLLTPHSNTEVPMTS